MSINLLDMAKGYLTDAVVSRVSNSFGESPEGTQKALTGALPVVLGSLVSRSNTSDGPGFLTGLLQQFTQSTSASPQATTLTDEDPDLHLQRGTGLIDSLFGSNSSLVSGALSHYAGVKSSSASGMLGMAGSLIASLLGRHLLSSGSGLNADSVTNLLADQRDSVNAAMPSGLSGLLSNIPGLGSLGGMLGGFTGASGSALSDAAGSVASSPTPTFDDVRSTNVRSTGTSVPPTPTYRGDERDDRGRGFNFWPWLLGLLAAGLLYFLVRGCGDKPTDTTTIGNSDTTATMMPDATATADSASSSLGAMTDTAATAVGNAVENVGDALAGAAASLGTFGKKKLPDGVELNIPANGVENKLLAFIEDANKPVDKTTWFNFDRLLYETGSANLKPESREQLQNVAAILKAYPNVNLKIGGYTDNTGNAANNKKLSQSRAESAMKELISLGVSASRLEAEGYGQEHPVASNDTEAGRAQNRRTAMRVTKK